MVSSKFSLKSTKVRSVTKWWSKCISMAITKTASSNVAFKVARTKESTMGGQDELIVRTSESEEVGLEDDNQAVLDDVGYNADLYFY